MAYTQLGGSLQMILLETLFKMLPPGVTIDAEAYTLSKGPSSSYLGVSHLTCSL